MTIAIHQPNYLPWLGYFYKIFAADVFVFHDAVEFSKASYTKRCKIRSHKTASDTVWLSVPVKKHHTGSDIHDILIADEREWIIRHLAKVKNTYAAAPYFATNFEFLKDLMHRLSNEKRLAHCNATLVMECAKHLGLSARFVFSSQLKASGKGTDLNLSIVKELGGTAYLAGIGSLNYQDDAAFQQASIVPVMHDFGKWIKSHPYDQGTGAFTGGLSLIDALMHIGVEGVQDLFHQFHASEE